MGRVNTQAVHYGEDIRHAGLHQVRLGRVRLVAQPVSAAVWHDELVIVPQGFDVSGLVPVVDAVAEPVDQDYGRSVAFDVVVDTRAVALNVRQGVMLTRLKSGRF